MSDSTFMEKIKGALTFKSKLLPVVIIVIIISLLITFVNIVNYISGATQFILDCEKDDTYKNKALGLAITLSVISTLSLLAGIGLVIYTRFKDDKSATPLRKFIIMLLIGFGLAGNVYALNVYPSIAGGTGIFNASFAGAVLLISSIAGGVLIHKENSQDS